MGKVTTETHHFFCLNCGKDLPLSRKSSQRKIEGHRKVLYCPFCKKTCNHYECITFAEIQSFKEGFDNGEFVEEAIESIKKGEEGDEY